MMGIGNELVAPVLSPDEELDGDAISRIFAQKIIWLVPSEPLSSGKSPGIADILVNNIFCIADSPPPPPPPQVYTLKGHSHGPSLVLSLSYIAQIWF